MGYRQRSLGSTFKFKCIYSMIILFELQIFIIQITKMISIIFKKLKDIVMSSAKTNTLALSVDFLVSSHPLGNCLILHCFV